MGKCSQHIIRGKKTYHYKAIYMEHSKLVRKKYCVHFFNWKNMYKNINSTVSGE